MRALRALLALTGAVVCLWGLATIVAPETAAEMPVSEAVAVAGNDYVLVAILGSLGVAMTLAVSARQSIRGIDQATPPDPEGLPTGRRPGARFDAAIDAWRGFPVWLHPRRREHLRERLSEAAVGTVMRTAGCSAEEARRRVERGTWTDDPEAAAFLATNGGLDPVGSAVALVHGESPVRRRARRTVLAIERLEEGERP